jgi:hypothetical protein
MDTVDGVTLANWRQSPWSQAAFQHVSDLIAAAPVRRRSRQRQASAA